MILFKTFFDANTAREFLQNPTIFKDSEKNNFIVRWFKHEDENILSDCLRSKVVKYTNKYYENMNMMMNRNIMGGNPNVHNNQVNGQLNFSQLPFWK